MKTRRSRFSLLLAIAALLSLAPIATSCASHAYWGIEGDTYYDSHGHPHKGKKPKKPKHPKKKHRHHGRHHDD